jgi:hypothetical protein
MQALATWPLLVPVQIRVLAGSSCPYSSMDLVEDSVAARP